MKAIFWEEDEIPYIDRRKLEWPLDGQQSKGKAPSKVRLDCDIL